MLGIIGYLQLFQKNYQLKPNGLEAQFSKYRKGQVGIANNFEGALFLLTEGVLKDIKQTTLKAFVEDQLTDKEYKTKKEKKQDDSNSSDASKIQLYEIAKKLSYSDKFKLVETSFLRKKIDDYDQEFYKKYYNADYETYYKYSDKIYEISDKLTQNPCCVDDYNSFEHLS